MIQAIGFLELNSIAKGIQATDSMLKAADIQLLFSRPNCPGKYNVLISGDISAIKSSMDAGVRIGQHHVVDKLEIPRVHSQVIKAINSSSYPQKLDAIGVLEYFSITASIIGADNAVKAANVNILDIRLGTGIGGKSFVVLSGDTASINEAIKNGAMLSNESGLLISKVVISNPRPELLNSLF